MSATRYKRPDVDIFICIELGRERNLSIKKTPGTLNFPSKMSSSRYNLPWMTPDIKNMCRKKEESTKNQEMGQPTTKYSSHNFRMPPEMIFGSLTGIMPTTYFKPL